LKKPTKQGRFLLLALILFFEACQTPPVPSEVAQAEALEQTLRGAGGFIYEEENYARFQAGLKAARGNLAREKAKWGWFRNYRPLQSELRDLLKKGADLLSDARERKAAASRNVVERMLPLKSRIDRLKNMTQYFNESGDVRKNLSQAEIKLAEADLLIRKEQLEPVREKLQNCSLYIEQAEEAIFAVLSRYLEKGQLEKWNRWADETIAESRKKGIVVIVVNKLERRLILYNKGAAVANYEIGLGKYGLSDKLYSGDDATPEGRYLVIRKIPSSPFYKALLINYPNEEDKRAFAAAKKNGLVPSEAGIGGSIEIHGGGKDNLTRGCVGLEDKEMDEVFRLAGTGTPVTIVGALSLENSILAEIKKLRKND
jgi:L,D-peptidoglycan transpeptidase YkuD (ErfK/YbiS/YcfS/YnhG family)